MENEVTAPEPTEPIEPVKEPVPTDTPGEETPEEVEAKTPEQLRIDELERENKKIKHGLERKRQQVAEWKARASLTNGQIGVNNQGVADDSETLSLTRAEIADYVKREAQRLAPTLVENQAEIERRSKVVESLSKKWGQEKFDRIASELEDVFGGLVDSKGAPKPSTEALFMADDPATVIEYLTDPENAQEAQRISKLGAVQAGMEIAKLNSALKYAKKALKQPPTPLSPVKGSGKVTKTLDTDNFDEFVKLRREQIAQRSRL